MFNNDHMSDVKFAVRKANEERGIIPAHKFVLSISSPVFEEMFYGRNSEAADEDFVEMQDYDNDSFYEFLRFCYSDEVKLTGRNVMQVAILADRFLVPSLTDKCSKFISDNLDASNAFNILPLAVKRKENDIVNRCWEVIDKQTKISLESEGFVTIERPLLEAVVERDTLTIREMELFAAVNQWAAMECQRQGLTIDGENKRRMLGKRVLREIRFSLMTENELSTFVRDSKILTTVHEEEIVNFVRYFQIALSSRRTFPGKRRAISFGDARRMCRFASANGVWKYNNTSKDSIVLSTDRDILLQGLYLFGSDSSSYHVALEVNEVDSYSALGCNRRGHGSVSVAKLHGTYPSQYTSPDKMGEYHGVKLLFDFGVILKKNAWYCIEAVISGSSTLRGEGGSRYARSSGVTFTFRDSYQDTNGTRITSGQFPELMFYLLPPSTC